DGLLDDPDPADGREAEEGVHARDDLACFMLEMQRSHPFAGYDQHGRLEGVVVLHPARPLYLFGPRTARKPGTDDILPRLDEADRDTCAAAQHRVEYIRRKVAYRGGVAKRPFSCHGRRASSCR